MPRVGKSRRRRDSANDERSLDEPNKPEVPVGKSYTVFDAVAGRAMTRGYNKDSKLDYGQTQRILAPEEALFQSRAAPQRFAEDDIYWADRYLPPDCLPESDLLEAIHVFAADFYESTTIDHGKSDTQSLDASALLALGVLLEESAREILGETGDLVFVEGLPVDSRISVPSNTTNTEQQSEDVSASQIKASQDEGLPKREAKRRRL